MSFPNRRQMEAALRAAGYRLTRPRRAILDYLATTASHPSVRAIYQAVRARCHNLSLATVYNTIQVLEREGLIKVFDLDGEKRCEINLSPHINLICTQCGAIQDFEGVSAPSAADLQSLLGFRVLDCHMEYYGLCAACQQAGPPLANDSSDA